MFSISFLTNRDHRDASACHRIFFRESIGGCWPGGCEDARGTRNASCVAQLGRWFLCIFVAWVPKFEFPQVDKVEQPTRKHDWVWQFEGYEFARRICIFWSARALKPWMLRFFNDSPLLNHIQTRAKAQRYQLFSQTSIPLEGINLYKKQLHQFWVPLFFIECVGKG